MSQYCNLPTSSCTCECIACCKLSQGAYAPRRRLSGRSTPVSSPRTPHPPNSVGCRDSAEDLQCIIEIRSRERKTTAGCSSNLAPHISGKVRVCTLLSHVGCTTVVHTWCSRIVDAHDCQAPCHLKQAHTYCGSVNCKEQRGCMSP